MDLMTGLAAIKQTLDITKELRSIDDKIVVAEFKLRISEIVDKLLDAKQALVDAQEREMELRKEVSDLLAARELKAKLKDSDGLLYEINDTGGNVGEPYCNLCYVNEDKLIRMRHHPPRVRIYSHYQCDNCKTSVVTGPALPSPEPRRKGSSWI